MKYCSNCGSEVLENSIVCLNCGKIIYTQRPTKKVRTSGKILGIISLVVWIVPLAGWIVGSIGLSKSDTSSHRNLNIIGIILSTIMFIINIVLIFI